MLEARNQLPAAQRSILSKACAAVEGAALEELLDQEAMLVIKAGAYTPAVPSE
jgi:hypothetical protein